MIRNIFSVFLIITALSVNAQSHQDALFFSETDVIGTARTAAMGNAFGALGADISVLSTNPAGLGVYQSYDFAYSLNLSGRDMTSYYRGNKIINSTGNFNLPSVGFVAPLSASKDSDWRRTNLGFAYNTTKVFRSNTIQSAYNSNSSLVDVYLASAMGNTLDDLDPFFELGAFDTDLIDLQTDSSSWIDDGNYFREVETGQDQFNQTSISGSMGEFAISYAGSYQEKIYLGGTIGLTNINYQKKTRYNERNFADTNSTIQSFDVYENQMTTGSGINLKLGAIYRANDNFRIGLAWHSPTLNDMHDEWEMTMRTQHSLNDSDFAYSYTSPYGIYDYEIVTPMKVIGSAALILDKLLLSADIEFVDYSTMQLNGDDYDYFTNQENIISNNYTDVVNTRLGAELNLSPILIRGGYSYYQNPLVSDEMVGAIDEYRNEKTSYTVGIGKRGKYRYIDLAYVFSEYSEGQSLYSTVFEPAHKTTNTSYSLIFTMGWKF